MNSFSSVPFYYDSFVIVNGFSVIFILSIAILRFSRIIKGEEVIP